MALLKKILLLAAAAVAAVAAVAAPAELQNRAAQQRCDGYEGSYGCTSPHSESIGVCNSEGRVVISAKCGGNGCCQFINDLPYCVC